MNTITTPQLALSLWHDLWETYRQRVVYARQYQAMIEADGGTLANDHIAFRSLDVTLSQGSRNLGLSYLEPFVTYLGYEVADEYDFPDQHLAARHYRHPQQADYDLPKLFISELKVDELPEAIAALIYTAVESCHLSSLSDLKQQSPQKQLQVLKQVFTRPWLPPLKTTVEAVNAVSQYGAWVLIHGYAVNHFTGFVNRQQSPHYPDIVSTAEGLQRLGIPMKPTIEGSMATGLRQTATLAVKEMVPVRDQQGQALAIEWPYAYYEIAERFTHPQTHQLFEGFLTAQAKALFRMTQQSPPSSSSPLEHV